MTKARLRLMPKILVVLSLSKRSDPYFLASCSLNAREKGHFQDSKELKMN